MSIVPSGAAARRRPESSWTFETAAFSLSAVKAVGELIVHDLASGDFAPRGPFGCLQRTQHATKCEIPQQPTRAAARVLQLRGHRHRVTVRRGS